MERDLLEEIELIDKSFVKRIAEQVGISSDDFICASYEYMEFAKACYALGAEEQREKDAQICDRKWDGWVIASAQKPKVESWPDGYTPYDCAKSIRNRSGSS